jgi:hypothetical protein
MFLSIGTVGKTSFAILTLKGSFTRERERERERDSSWDDRQDKALTQCVCVCGFSDSPNARILCHNAEMDKRMAFHRCEHEYD